MFLSQYLVFKIVLAAVTGGRIAYPTAADLVLKYDSANKLFLSGGALNHVTDITLFKDDVSYELGLGSIQNKTTTTAYEVALPANSGHSTFGINQDATRYVHQYPVADGYQNGKIQVYSGTPSGGYTTYGSEIQPFNGDEVIYCSMSADGKYIMVTTYNGGNDGYKIYKDNGSSYAYHSAYPFIGSYTSSGYTPAFVPSNNNFVITGTDNNSTWYFKLYVYNSSTETWTAKAQVTPSGYSTADVQRGQWGKGFTYDGSYFFMNCNGVTTRGEVWSVDWTANTMTYKWHTEEGNDGDGAGGAISPDNRYVVLCRHNGNPYRVYENTTGDWSTVVNVTSQFDLTGSGTSTTFGSYGINFSGYSSKNTTPLYIGQFAGLYGDGKFRLENWSKRSPYQIYINKIGKYSADLKICGLDYKTNEVDVTSLTIPAKTIQVSTGGFVSLALTEDGFVYTWGDDVSGNMGQGTSNSDVNTPVKVKGVGGSGFLSNITKISCGGYHSMALASDGTLYAWGRNTEGQCGDGSTDERDTPVVVSYSGDAISNISAGFLHSGLTTTTGKVYCWGTNGNGGLGDNSTTQKNTPTQVVGVGNVGTLAGIRDVTCGDSFTLAIKDSDGSAYGWGKKTYGMIGNGDNSGSTNTPVSVILSGGSAVTGLKQISAGGDFSLYLKTDGTVYAAGYGAKGQMGDGSADDNDTGLVQVHKTWQGPSIIYCTSTSDTPASQASGYTFKRYATADIDDYIVYALNDTGNQYNDHLIAWRISTETWVDGDDTSIGDGTAGDQEPVTVNTWSGNSNYIENTYASGVKFYFLHDSSWFTHLKITQIAASESSSLALKNDGTMYSWGNNLDGQNGLGTVGGTNPSTPVAITSLTGVDSINNDGKGYTFIASKSDGSVFCWGRGDAGQIGDGTNTADQGTPTQVLAGAGPSIGGKFNLLTDPRLTFDDYNKFSINHGLSHFLSRVSSKLVYGSNVYDIGTLTSDITIEKPGEYVTLTKDTWSNVAYFSNVTVSSVASTTASYGKQDQILDAGADAAFGSGGDATQGGYGNSIDMSADGTRMVVGNAHYTDSNGRVWLYHLENGSWVLKQTWDGGTRLGSQVAMNEAGTRVFAVSPKLNASNPGFVRIWDYSSGAWDTSASGTYSIAPGTINQEVNGVDCNKTGDIVIIGSGNSSNNTWIYRLSGGSWSSEKNFSRKGSGVSMNGDGTRCFMGDQDSHKVWESNYSGGSWGTETEIIDESSFSGYWPASLSTDSAGETVCIKGGDSGNGAIYERAGNGSWSASVSGILSKTEVYGTDKVALSYDGTVAIFGHMRDSGALSTGGHAILYTKSGSTWSIAQTLLNPSSSQHSGDYFGGGTGLAKTAKDRFVVAAMGDDNAGTNYGAIYTYTNAIPDFISFDTYNKLSISSITPTSTTLKYFSNTYDIGTATNIYIESEGTYTAEITASDKFALDSNVVGSLTTPSPNSQLYYPLTSEPSANIWSSTTDVAYGSDGVTFNSTSSTFGLEFTVPTSGIFTVSWNLLKTSFTSGVGVIIASSTNQNSPELESTFSATSHAWRSTNTGYVNTTGLTHYTNQWYHMIWVHDKNNGLTAYLDGVEVYSYSGTIGSPQTSFIIGPNYLDQDGSPGTNQFGAGGKMSDIRIYNTAISSTEAELIYKADNKYIPKLTFDGYNKYTFTGADTGSTYKLKYESNTYDLGTISDVYIAHPGTYSAEIKGATNFVLSSNVATIQTVTQPTLVSSISITTSYAGWGSYTYEHQSTNTSSTYYEYKISADPTNSVYFIAYNWTTNKWYDTNPGTTHSTFGTSASDTSSTSRETTANPAFVYVMASNALHAQFINPYFLEQLSLDFDGYNKLTISDNTSEGQLWPPSDGTWSISTDTSTLSEWTISGASYGNGSYKATSSVATNGIFRAYQAFEGTETGNTSCWQVIATAGILSIELPYEVVIDKYAILCRNYLLSEDEDASPKDFTFEGSSDGSTWVVLDTVTGNGYYTAEGTASQQTFTTSNTTAYKHYRLNVTANNGDSGTVIGELKLLAVNNSTNLKYFSNTYDIGTATNIYIENAGTYEADKTTTETLTLTSNVTGTVTQVDAYDYTNTTEQKLTAGANAAASERFGESVAVSGDYAIAGAPFDPGESGAGNGAAYIFVRNGTSLTRQARIVASDGASADQFGISVAIDGDYAVIGASGDDSAGSAYIFVRSGTSWTQQAKLTSSDGASSDNFGWRVSISGNYAIVGAYDDDDDGASSGSAYIFVRSGTSWTQQAKLTSSDAAAGDNFGYAVGIDGDYAIVGSRNSDPGSKSNAGAAYIFVRSEASPFWSQQAILTASDAVAGDNFGYSVAIVGDYAIVGALYGDSVVADAGSAYVFVRSDASWSEQSILKASDIVNSDYYGESVAIYGDYAIVGAPYKNSYAGAVYIFNRTGTNWTQQAKIIASDGASSDFFGKSVAIYEDYVFSGAFGDDDGGAVSGSAYIYIAPNSIPKLDFDGYKLVVKNITPTSTTLKYFSNTYEIGTATNIYVENTGNYTAEIGNSTDFAFTSKTVSGTIKTIEPGFASRYFGKMALTYDGKLYGWGENSEGEAGVGTTSDITVPTLCTGITQGTVAKLLRDSELTDGTHGQVSAIKTTDGKIHMAGKGDNFCIPGETSDQTSFTDVTSYFGDQSLTANTVTMMSFTDESGAALTETGNVWTWGTHDSTYKKLGQAGASSSSTPKQINFSSATGNITKITSGHYHNLALDSSGNVWFWGKNGINSDSWPSSVTDEPQKVVDGKNIIGLASSYGTMYAFDATGKMWNAGNNWEGQIGDGTTTASSSGKTLTEVTYFSSKNITINKVYGGGYFVFVDTSDGYYYWGNGGHGVFGNGSTGNHTIPVKWTHVSNIKKFVACTQSTAAIAEDGKYYAWGKDQAGQRGDSDSSSDISYPKYIKALPNILAYSFEHDGYDKVFVGGNSHVIPPSVINFHRDGSAEDWAENGYAYHNITNTAGGPQTFQLRDSSGTANGDGSQYNISIDFQTSKYVCADVGSSSPHFLMVGDGSAPSSLPTTTTVDLINSTDYLYIFQSNSNVNGYSILDIRGPLQRTKFTKNTVEYDAGNAKVVTVSDLGTYDTELNQGGSFTLKSATVPATSSTGLYTWAFHHGNFDNAYGDGDILTARDNGRFYADTPAYTGTIGTITSNPNINSYTYTVSFKVINQSGTTTYDGTDGSIQFTMTEGVEYDTRTDLSTALDDAIDTALSGGGYSSHAITILGSSSYQCNHSGSIDSHTYTLGTLDQFHSRSSGSVSVLITNPYYNQTTYTFAPPSGGLTANVMMVAGGGGGGGRAAGGGGGAGGLVYTAGTILAQGVTKTIVVGNGDSGGYGEVAQNGYDGKDTTFTDLTPAVGGGGGGNSTSGTGVAGGSGGGGGGSGSGGAAASGSQGTAGGASSSGSYGGGGGGAGAAGSDYSGDYAGDGGIGKFFGTGSSFTDFGDEYGEGGYFAGGGAGGSNGAAGKFGGTPGRGGGGYGGNYYGYMGINDSQHGGSQHGMVHTGSGGGGSGSVTRDQHPGYNTTGNGGVKGHGGRGGSGIVLIQTNVAPPNGGATAVVQVGNPRRRSLPPAVSYMGSEVNRFYIIDSASMPTYKLPTHWYVDPIGANGNSVFSTQGSHSLQKRADGGTSNVWYTTSNHYIAEYGNKMAQSADAVFMPVEAQRYDVLLSIGSNGQHDIQLEMAADGTAKLYRDFSTLLQAGTITCFTVGKWHHIALTVDSGGNAVGYVNGHPVVSTRYTSIPTLGSRSGNMHMRVGVVATFRKFLTYEVSTYNFHMTPKQVLQRAAEVGLGPKLEYDGLNTINVVNTELNSSIKIYEQNTTDTSNIFAVSCESSYTLSNAATYYAEIKGTNTYTITRPLTVSDDHFPLYAYPPTDGTTSSLTVATAANSFNNYWTISGAAKGNGQYQVKCNTAADNNHYNAWRNNVGETNQWQTAADPTYPITFTILLPSAKTIRKYRMFPLDHDNPNGAGTSATPGTSIDPTLPGNSSGDATKRPKSWVIKGSNSDGSWTTLDTVTNKPISIYGDVYSVDSPASYLYYQVSITANNGGNKLLLGDIQLWGDA